MSDDKIFVDTNILVCGHDMDAGQKHNNAQNLLTDLWNHRSGVLSVQVLQEFYVTLTKKVLHPLSPSTVRNLIRDYISWQVEVNDTLSVWNASRIEENYGISFGMLSLFQQPQRPKYQKYSPKIFSRAK